MPLVKGRKASTRKGFAKNISTERRRGHKKDQAIAIAYSEADRGRKKSTKGRKKKSSSKVKRMGKMGKY